MIRRGLIGICALALVSVAVSLIAQTNRRGGARADDRSLTVEEYTPRSTLVVSEHPVPSAKFPVVDVHSHHRPGLSGERWNTIVREMDELNLQVLVNLSGGNGATLARGVRAIRQSPHPDRMVLFANLDFSNGVTPGFGARAAAQLERDVAAGAVGLKLFKNFGLTVRDGQGQRVPVDHPELDPVWDMCARAGHPGADPHGRTERVLSTGRPLQRAMARADCAARTPSPDGSLPGLRGDHGRTGPVVRTAPGEHASSLPTWAGTRTTSAGSVPCSTGFPTSSSRPARFSTRLGRQPLAARAFFAQYGDRVLFGKDTYAADEFPYYWRTFETRDEYFDYYRRYHAFWKLYGMGLSDDILREGLLRERPACGARDSPWCFSHVLRSASGYVSGHRRRRFYRVSRRRRARLAAVSRYVWSTVLVTGRRDNLAHVPGVDLTVGDLADPAMADRATTGVDYVVHLAAIPSVPRSVAEPIATNHANVTGTLSLFVAAQRSRGGNASCSPARRRSMGNAATLPEQEDMPPAPLSPYALQKLIG